MYPQVKNKRKMFMFISFTLGIGLGILQNGTINIVAEYFIEIFVNLLKFISLPIIFLSISVAIARLNDITHFKNVFGKTIQYTLLTTIAAAFIAMIIYRLLNPALVDANVDMALEHSSVTNIGKYLLNIVPSNIVKIFMESNVMAITSSALLIGICSLSLEKSHKKNVYNTLNGFFELFMMVTSFIVRLLPFVLWAFIVVFIKDIKTGFATKTLLYYALAIVLANMVQAILVLPAFLKAKGIPVITTFKGMLPALITAFFSKSSSAAMPSTLNCVEKNLGIDSKISSITIPLCTSINMNACAAFIYITVLFVAQSNGVVFSTVDYFSWIFLATLAAIGNAGVPMGCFFMASAFLASMGVSTYLMGIILPFYAILDMFETAINVWSDSCVTAIVAAEVAEVPLPEVAAAG